MNAAEPPPDIVHFLLVDDDEVDTRAIQRTMKKRRLDNPVTIARNGVEALAVLRGEDGRERLPWPHVVLLDLNMPLMNGIEFLQAVRADPALASTTVFVLTTSDSDRDKVAAYQLQVAGYLLKREAAEDLLQVVALLEEFVVTVRFPSARP